MKRRLRISAPAKLRTQIIMEIDTKPESLPVIQALANETRLAIINLVNNQELNLSEIAEKLDISKAITTRHIQQLEDAKILKSIRVPGKSGLQKKVSLAIDHLNIVFPEKIYPATTLHTTEVRIGHYTDFEAESSCGLCTEDEVISQFDDVQAFLDSKRVDAQIIWLSKGFLEYKIPITFGPDETLDLLEVSFEIASEYPISNNTWTSDISFYINEHFLGNYMVPGNFADVRGRLTPIWWPDIDSQYGLLKHLRINRYDTTMDGVSISSVTLKDLNLSPGSYFTFRIAVDKNSKKIGGLTLFGDKWGNHPQNIRIRYYTLKSPAPESESRKSPD